MGTKLRSGGIETLFPESFNLKDAENFFAKPLLGSMYYFIEGNGYRAIYEPIAFKKGEQPEEYFKRKVFRVVSD